MKTHTRIISFPFLFLALITSLISNLHAEDRKHLPVVLVHGIFSDTDDMRPIEAMIEKYMPGTYVKNVQIGLGKITSFWNMYTQGEWLSAEIQSDPELANGFNIIAHSQGGLVARYYVERYNEPKVHNLITWGTPHMGVYGTPGTYDNRFIWLNYIETIVYQLMYMGVMQNFTSFSNYWRDTMHYDLYLSNCQFLPCLNNEKDHSLAAHFKRHICDLQNMVCVMSPQDTIVEPVESCHFGFYRIGTNYEIESLQDSAWYKNDNLGLKTLSESGRLHLKLASCTHTGFQTCEDNFVETTLPFLKRATAEIH